jgi:hypothetical protein
MTLKERDQPAFQTIDVFGFALPNRQNTPSVTYQRSVRNSIAESVPAHFRAPEIYITFRHAERFALVLVPKTSMHENHAFTTGQNQIGTPRQRALFYCRMANGTRLAVCLFSQPLALWGVNYAYSTWHTCCISWHNICSKCLRN